MESENIPSRTLADVSPFVEDAPSIGSVFVGRWADTVEICHRFSILSGEKKHSSRTARQYHARERIETAEAKVLHLLDISY